MTETRFTEIPGANRLDPSFSTTIKRADSLDIETEVSPALLGALLIKPDRLSIINLFSYINHLQENKQDYQRYAISFWKKVIYPFTILVMLALALPFAYLQTRSGGIGYKVSLTLSDQNSFDTIDISFGGATSDSASGCIHMCVFYTMDWGD